MESGLSQEAAGRYQTVRVAPNADASSLISRLARALALGLAPLALLCVAAPLLQVPPLGGIAIAFATACAAILCTTGTAPYGQLTPIPRGLGIAIAGGALMGAGYLLTRAAHGDTLTDVVAGLVGTAGVLCLGTIVGALVGLRIQDPGHLTAVALASSAADLWSVHAPEGVTHALVATPDVALQRLLTVSSAVPPSRTPDAVIGLGDVLFAALYLATTARHGLPRRRMLAAIGIGLLLAGASTFAARMALPALPFIGAMVVLSQPRVRVIAPKDRFPTIVAGALVVAAVLRVFVWHS